MRLYLVPLALIETSVIYASYYAAAYLRFGGSFEAARAALGNLELRAAVFTCVALVALLAVGLYRAWQRVRPVETFLRLGTAFTLAAGIDAIVYYFVPVVATGRGTQILALVTALLGLLVTRRVFYSFAGNNRFKRSILVYGNGRAAASLTRFCDELGQRSFRIAGYIGMVGDTASEECDPVLHRADSLFKLVRELRVDEIVVAVDNRRNAFPMRELLDCRLAGVRVTEALTFAERETGRIDLGALHPSWLIYGHGFRQGALDKFLKRAFDIVASSLLLIIALPLLAVAAIAIAIESRGKGGVFLTQKRVGLRGSTFEMLKMRSMVADAEHDGHARWAMADDPRVTRVGALMRRLRIDELPQVVNILKGEMSFVGPRPERPEFVKFLSEQIPYYADRQCVKPGLTGWAQLSYPYGSSVEDARQKLQFDLFYVKNHNPMFDLWILLQTLDIVIWNKSHRDAVQSPGLQEQSPDRRIA